jgi:hypothetical protein
VNSHFGPELKRLLNERVKKNAGEPLSMGLPQFDAPANLLKKYMSRHCKIGSGTTIAAHGPGWIRKVELKDFQATLSPSPLDGAAFISISSKTDLKERPFFYSTIVPASNNNHFQFVHNLELKPDMASDADRKRVLAGLPMKDPSDRAGTIRFFRYGKDGLLASVERNGTRGTNPKYQARWFDYIVLPSQNSRQAQVAFHGDSDFTRGSDQMEILGTLDMDGDGDLDVLLSGQYCIILCQRTQKGFRPFRLSNAF